MIKYARERIIQYYKTEKIVGVIMRELKLEEIGSLTEEELAEFLTRIKYSMEHKGSHYGDSIGLKDCNDKDISVGDIVKILYTDWVSKSNDDPRTLEEYLDSISKIGVITCDELADGCYIKFTDDKGDVHKGSVYCGEYGKIEIIGNIALQGETDGI